MAQMKNISTLFRPVFAIPLLRVDFKRIDVIPPSLIFEN